MKYACEHIYKALAKVYNQSLEQGIVPDILKLSKVTPIDKGGEITDATDKLYWIKGFFDFLFSSNKKKYE